MKSINKKKITAWLLTAVLGLSMASGVDSKFQIKADENNLSGPSLGTVVTWNCVQFGAYPQTEITKDENAAVYDALERVSGWSETGDVSLDGISYRRVQVEDVTSDASDYVWDGKEYHYFRYEPIKWRVLAREGEQLIAVSEQVIDTQRYNKIAKRTTWEQSTLRSWLNGYGTSENAALEDYRAENFIKTAFSDEECNSLVAMGNDKVCLMSKELASKENLGFNTDKTRLAKSTDYAKAMGVTKENGTESTNWWLSDRGNTELSAKFVKADGVVNEKGFSIAYAANGVRAMITLQATAKNIVPKGTVSSEGVVNEDMPISTSTPEPTTASSVTATPEITVAPTATASLAPSQTPDQIVSGATTATPIVTMDPNGDKGADAVVTSTPTPTEQPIVVGKKLYDDKSKATYKVMMVSENGGSVQYTKNTNSSATTITIPATIKVDGKNYKVISVGKAALKNNKKVKKIVIGKNVSAVMTNAFRGCSKVTTVKISSKLLTSKTVGKYAFKGLSSKVKFTVPAKKKKAYTSMLKKAGVASANKKVK